MALKMTESGEKECGCSECGKDMSPCPIKGKLFPAPLHKNCFRCRLRKSGGRKRHDIKRPQTPAEQVDAGIRWAQAA